MNSLTNVFSCENLSLNFFSLIRFFSWIILAFFLGYKVGIRTCNKKNN